MVESTASTNNDDAHTTDSSDHDNKSSQNCTSHDMSSRTPLGARTNIPSPRTPAAHPKRVPQTSPTRRRTPRQLTTYTPVRPPRSAPRPQTIDDIADDGRFGAVIFGADRSPDHAEHKRQQRENAFKDVEPVGPGSPFGFYNTSAPRRRGRVTGFKVPSFTPERAPGGSSVSTAASAATRPRGRPSADANKRTRAHKLRAALGSAFGEGDNADRVLGFWGRGEAGELRNRLIDRVADALQDDFDRMAAQGEPYDDVLADTCEALRLVRDARGVELVTSGRIERMRDPRVERFLHVAVCFRTVKLDD